MRTLTLQKPDGTSFQVNDHRSCKQQNNLQVNTRCGYPESVKTNSDEMLLPMGFSFREDGSIETQDARMKRVTANKKARFLVLENEDNNLLLPAGIEYTS